MAAVSNLSNNLEEEEEEEEDDDDDEYIDMELNSFEFQMSSVSMKKEPTNSPADELFYKGKLLPLHLPPRLQMVKKLLQNSINEDNKFEEGYTYSNTTPFESRRVSRELSFEECLFEYSNDVVNGGNGEIYTKKSWTKKLKLMKQSSIIGSKLKAYSRVYLKSLFGNNNTKPAMATKKTPLEEEQVFHLQERNRNRHRRSYSLMAIKRHSSPSSSSSSTTTNEYDQNLLVLKRSSSVNAEIESSSIQGAIAHCKQSQKSMIRSRKTLSEVGFYSFSPKSDIN